MYVDAKLKQMSGEISKLKKTAVKLSEMGNDFPAVERNLRRILASIKMLELNVSDLVLTEENDLS
jgi:hypothetical protein